MRPRRATRRRLLPHPSSQRRNSAGRVGSSGMLPLAIRAGSGRGCASLAARPDGARASSAMLARRVSAHNVNYLAAISNGARRSVIASCSELVDSTTFPARLAQPV